MWKSKLLAKLMHGNCFMNLHAVYMQKKSLKSGRRMHNTDPGPLVRIGFMASEEMSFEMLTDGRRTDCDGYLPIL